MVPVSVRGFPPSYSLQPWCAAAGAPMMRLVIATMVILPDMLPPILGMDGSQVYRNWLDCPHLLPDTPRHDTGHPYTFDRRGRDRIQLHSGLGSGRTKCQQG